MESSLPSLHLAMAALVGASLMALSAFYVHKRTVDQVLDRLIEIRRGSPNSRRKHSIVSDEGVDFDFEEEVEERSGNENDDDDDNDERDADVYGSDGEMVDDIEKKMWKESASRSLDDRNVLLPNYTISCSMPNAVLSNDWFNQEQQPVRFRAQGQGDRLNFIPFGLPPLRTSHRDGDNKSVNYSSSITRMASHSRLITPRSPGGAAFESMEDSDEEGTEYAIGDDTIFNNANMNSSAEHVHDVDSKVQSSSVPPSGGDSINSIHDQNIRDTRGETEVVDSLGIKVDTSSLHQVRNDPAFAMTILPPRLTMHESVNIEEEEVKKMIRESLDLRSRYVYREEAPWKKLSAAEPGTPGLKSDPFHFEPVPATKHHFRMEDGVAHVYASENDTVDLFPVASATTFFTDLHHLLRIISIGNVRTACHHRLRFLEEKFRLHLLVNADREFLAQKSAPHRDFYNIRKVDTHVHHSACMNQKHLLHFIKSKLRKEPDEVVIFRDGKYMTLKEVFESLDLTGYDLNVDLLDVHADKSTFHRFDKFNLKYNPCGQSRLREIFLKQDNLIQGRFLAEVTKEVLTDLEASKYQMAEYRISIYGRKQSEWDQLASWFVNNAIYSENAVWLIQLPRLYNVYKELGTVKSFQNILDNVFIPLFEVTINPSSHPQLHLFLMQVVGLDIVDDESRPERRPTKHMPKPAEWTNEFNPAYSYYAYYCYANLYTLNKLRESKGFSTIKFRPHCGEAGDIDHLAAAFLLCHNISHGINLRKSPVLQYLYYLAQIGLAMSPLSNNSLFLNYHRNPLPMFFQRGLNVSLSTDDPLQIHLTREPLVEEYSIAAKVWKLSSCDLCEIARNSVYQSGFSHVAKLHWLGSKYFVRGPEGNDIHKTNVPHMRIDYRHETWKEEMQYVYSGRANFPQEIEF
ncbi:probable AMP deaminase [Ricinus communis]|uniref:probable AMP deaminase n=1 Tax=Ricinus communis TaxID=3988 RepID=UPI0007721FB0|nr:probable AMP deaminase [Ricinus communis]|eukprot:XP_015575300.1 probable AMP deaminase [Ricinus communis]